jgi:RecA-family ATPase
MSERTTYDPDDRSTWINEPPGTEEARRKQKEKRKPNGSGEDHDQDDDDHELPQIRWRDARLSDWADREIPDRRWIVPDWIPREQVTGLYGPAGVDKTNFLLQLAMAAAAGLVFIGYELTAVPAYSLFCEDTTPEIIRRASRIAAHYGRSLADFPDFHFASLVGVDDKEFVTFDGPRISVGRAMQRFDQTIMRLGAGIATLDTLPHFFGGNEIVRRDVTRFVSRLDAISIARGCSVLFTAHPSVRGKTAGTYDSGSTAWEGGVRSRLSLHDPGLEDDDDDKVATRVATDRRILTRQKANYARSGEILELVCRKGVFTTAALDPERAATRQRGPGRDAACEVKFLDLLAKIEAQGGYVHDAANNPSHYAPKVFAKRPDGKVFSASEYSRAMQHLFVAKRIRLGPFGPPSRARNRIVEAHNRE